MTEIYLSNEEANKIRIALKGIVYQPFGDEAYITALRLTAYQCISPRILKMLETQRISKTPLPYIIFHNVPIDEVIYGSPTSIQTGKDFKSGNLSENVICALASIVGEPYAIAFESHELVSNLTPQTDTKMDYTGLGSEVELDFHIENAALKYLSEDDYSPTGLFLLGIRTDPNYAGPNTCLADARLALKQLAKADIDTLYGENFTIRLPHRWREAFPEQNATTRLYPILSGPLALPRVSAVFYADMVSPMNEKAKKAFVNFYRAIQSVSIGIKITPGCMIYVDNRFALHSREKFSPTYDKNNLPYRWIQRVFIAPNLWGFRSFACQGSRVFNPSEYSLEKQIL